MKQEDDITFAVEFGYYFFRKCSIPQKTVYGGDRSRCAVRFAASRAEFLGIISPVYRRLAGKKRYRCMSFPSLTDIFGNRELNWGKQS